MSKLYRVHAVIDGQMGEKQTRYASYQAHEQLLDAGAGQLTLTGHCFLGERTVIALELLLQDGRGAAHTASVALAQLLLRAGDYFEDGLIDDDEENGLSYEDEIELRIFENDGYEVRDFKLEYALGSFAGDEAAATVLRTPDELAGWALDGAPEQQRAWHALVYRPRRAAGSVALVN